MHCIGIRVPYVHVYHRSRIIASYASKMLRRVRQHSTSNIKQVAAHEHQHAA